MSLRGIITIAVLVVGVIIFSSSVFIIREGRQAIITQFGKPVRTITKAGLHFKKPFVQDIRLIDMRILNWDGYPNQIPTKDKKYIEVDTTARWKIVNPLTFIQTVQNERGARSRLDAILDGVTRDIISGQNLVEAVRNSNAIFDTLKERNKILKEKIAAGKVLTVEDEEVTGEIASVKIGREKLSELIIKRAEVELLPLGIKLIDVQLKRISYEASVEKKVYARMISERQRIAEKIRSIGAGEKAKIEGKTEKDLQTIQSIAYRKVQKIKGNAEGKAIRIYAKSLRKDPDFFEFTRTLEAYDKGLQNQTKFLLSTDSRFWRVLMGK